MNDVTRILNNVDNITQNFVFNSYQGFGAFADTIWTLMAITYIAFTGYKVVLSGNFDIPTLFGDFAKVLLILVAVTQWDFFGQAFYDVVIGVPNDMGGNLINSNGLLNVTAFGLNYEITGDDALGVFWTQGQEVVTKLFALAGKGFLFDFAIAFLAVVVWIAIAALTIAALLLLILAKFAVAIFMAVAPLFILFAMFQTTRPFFEGWLRMTVNYALIPLFVYAVLALILSMLFKPLSDLATNINDQTPLFPLVSPVILMAIVGTVILTQVLQMAAGVAGGFALATNSLISRVASPVTNFARNSYSRAVGRNSNLRRAANDRRDLRYLRNTAPMQRQLADARRGNDPRPTRGSGPSGGGRGRSSSSGPGNLAGTPTGARS